MNSEGIAYTYECEKCGSRKESRYHMTDTIPSRERCECGGDMLRDWNLGAIIIPPKWGEDRFKFNKSPSGKKHFW